MLAEVKLEEETYAVPLWFRIRRITAVQRKLIHGHTLSKSVRTEDSH